VLRPSAISHLLSANKEETLTTTEPQPVIENQKLIEEKPLLSTRPWDYWLLWFVALGSLALNVWLINTLLGVRRQTGEVAAAAAQGISTLRAETISYTFTINESVPININVPINETVRIPINTTLPIDTEVTIPLNTPFGQFPITVPIDTTIPVKLETNVPISLTIPIAARVPVVLDVPIQIAIAKTPLEASLAQAQAYLEKLAGQLGVGGTATPAASPTR
jgi:hypothetical protein